ncbi:MAG: putative DNA binding domain-containing protein [Proteobacteria bacterium]|nr:AAA family ATPase [Desulfocapsa sp.]MBU3944914.1 putative DNA binding domain-containing protein [Pseudomonadota bacterium]MCG2743143.1 putative DNA binding domain-containing protein [Desulfobacteraceae bacterium]MBU3984629.1 putative DNA binding domain-containing protein [Pseudomonadota bacterium]MBU4027560.1 putative DNA binding domain-containing protein [Pseudomonadota bacterium]
MRSADQIADLLLELDHRIADELEDQDLDFKQWDTQSRDKSVQMVVRMAVCMANGGGGTVVFGVADQVRGREQAILGMPMEIDINILKKAVYDQTDPKIMPVFEELNVPEGTGRLLLMHIHPGLPPYTDTSGRGTVRIGKDCQPLTGTLRRKIGVETGETDMTAELIAPVNTDLLSPSAMETLRNLAQAEHAPDDLLRLNDLELLAALGVIRDQRFTRAAILVGGNEDALRRYVPGFNWTFLQMKSDVDYGIREDRVSAVPLSVKRVEELLLPFNPITTLEYGLFHFEYRTWPAIAIREALMNAFCHVDLRIAGPVMVKLYADRLEISNNGGFIGGITPENILHHQPAARNPLLVEALTRLRLVNRSNLGVSRMFSSLLVEGKEPPLIQEIGESVTLTFFRRELSKAFRLFVTAENEAGRLLTVDALLILQYLLKCPEIETGFAATLCQRSEAQMRERLSSMEKMGYLEHGGTGRGAYWTLRPELYQRLAEAGHPERDRRIDWEAAKTRVLSILMERERRGEPGLSNQEIRQITHFDRNKVYRLMTELRQENTNILSPGRGQNARYEYRKQ